MKNLLKMLLFVLVPLIGMSQNNKIKATIEIDLSNYYTKAQTDSIARLLGRPPVIVPPIVIIPNCESGPDIKGISSITQTGIIPNWYGNNITGISWRVHKQSDTITIVKGGFVPKNTPNFPADRTPIQFGQSLDPGVYVLEYRGTFCVGGNERVFTIPKLTGDVITIPPTVDNTGVTPINIAEGLKDHLDLSFSKVNGGYLITDNTTFNSENGYEFWYYINGTILKTKTSLKNYPYLSSSPIRVLKMQGRDNLDTFNRWEGWNDGYYSTSAGATFSYNITAAFYTGIFSGAKTNFYNPIPEKYNPTLKTSQWADVTNPFKLPSGHILVLGRGDWPVEQVFNKGVSFISLFDFPENSNDLVDSYRKAGKTYSGVQRPEAFLGLSPSGPDNWVNGYNTRYWPNGEPSDEYLISKAQSTGLDALLINETEEGSSYMPKDRRMWGVYYKEVRKRQKQEFESRGIQSYLAHNYFSLGIPDLKNNPSRSDSKRISVNPNANGSYNFWINGSLKDNNLICIATYLNAPDLNLSILYDQAYQLINTQAARVDLNAAIFLQGIHEWRPNNLIKVKYDEGNYYMYEKIPLDPNVLIGSGFISHVFGKGIVEWGGSGHGSDQKKKITVLWRDGLWFKNGSVVPDGSYNGGKLSGEAFPYATVANDYSSPYNASVDLVAFGARMYAETFGITDGGAKKFLSFRVDGGQWITPSQNGSEEIVDAWFDKRGIAYSQTKSGRTAWFYLNVFADNLTHVIDVVLPNGETVTESVSSTGIHAKLTGSRVLSSPQKSVKKSTTPKVTNVKK